MFIYESSNRYYRLKQKAFELKRKIKSIQYRERELYEKIKLDSKLIPKYVNQLEKPPVFSPYVCKTYDYKYGFGIKKIEHHYKIDIGEICQQVLPEGFPKTRLWGYGGLVKDNRTGRIRYHMSSPGGTFEAYRGVPVRVEWVNKIKGKHLFAVDPTLHWANPNGMPTDPPKPWPLFPRGFRKAQWPVPTVTHLHGGEVSSDSDGHPEAWFTYNKKYGSAYKSNVYRYPNEQEPATLWYHDHTMGMTRLNVYAGLAGFYLIRDGKKSKYHRYHSEKRLNLPSGKYEIPLLIQDRMFNTDGSLLFNSTGLNPEINPYWVPGVFGDTILVNGKVWPNLNVDRGQYRFRLLNGSNTRFYNLSFTNGMKFIQIGTDGGLLRHPAELSSLLLAPAERADILVDFSEIKRGASIRLINDAPIPFPFGGPPDPETVGQIMQFTVSCRALRIDNKCKLPPTLNCIEELVPNAAERIITLNDIIGTGGPLQMLLNGQKWHAEPTEILQVGSTGDWCIVAMTGGAHPIHLHLIQFQLISRQNYNVEAYTALWEEVNGPLPLHHPPEIIPLKPFLLGEPIPPALNEQGWKDTVISNPGQILRLRVRIAPQDIPNFAVQPGDNYFPFNPTTGPGYVWHCHLLDYEDNEMMRPMIIEL